MNSNVMRLCSLVLSFFFCGIAGCLTGETRNVVVELPEAFEHCGPKQSDGWGLSARPSDFSTILAIKVEHGTIDSQLGHQGPAEANHEHWFAKDESHVAVCRHLDVPDSCDSDSTLAYVKKVEGQWLPDGPVLESICLVH